MIESKGYVKRLWSKNTINYWFNSLSSDLTSINIFPKRFWPLPAGESAAFDRMLCFMPQNSEPEASYRIKSLVSSSLSVKLGCWMNFCIVMSRSLFSCSWDHSGLNSILSPIFLILIHGSIFYLFYQFRTETTYFYLIFTRVFPNTIYTFFIALFISIFVKSRLEAIWHIKEFSKQELKQRKIIYNTVVAVMFLLLFYGFFKIQVAGVVVGT